jgi:uncharacterized protein YjbI with pentapeptide repeats
MDISFSCDKCGQNMVVDEAGAGIIVPCPGCNQQLTIPSAQPAPPHTSAATPTDASAMPVLEANANHLEILKRGSEAWNQWRIDNIDVTKPCLKAADLRNAILEKTKFDGADLREATLNGVNLGSASLNMANLEKANLEKAILEGTKANGANLHRANLRKASLFMFNILDWNVVSIPINLSEADIREAKLDLATLGKANLSGANLSGAVLGACHLRQADLRGANLSGADLSSSGEGTAGTRLDEADLRGAILTRANLQQTLLAGANLEGANLEEADLRRANLANANLRKADLRGAKLDDTQLDGADLSGAKRDATVSEEIKSSEQLLKSLPAADIRGIVLLLSGAITNSNADAVNDTVNGLLPLPLHCRMIHVENVNLDDQAYCLGVSYRALRQLGFSDPASIASSIIEKTFSVSGHQMRGRIILVRGSISKL